GEAKDSAVGARDSLDRKLREWKLTPEDIKQDLVQTGKVIRAKTTAVGERIDDARIIAVVKAKYVLDSDLSALAISVDCRDGDITLSGVVKSPALIGRAIALALETRGVRNVTSSLTVQS
ncbi:MAG: BON domain-containing protein, partial [Opitutaceae bacterium]